MALPSEKTSFAQRARLAPCRLQDANGSRQEAGEYARAGMGYGQVNTTHDCNAQVSEPIRVRRHQTCWADTLHVTRCTVHTPLPWTCCLCLVQAATTVHDALVQDINTSRRVQARNDTDYVPATLHTTAMRMSVYPSHATPPNMLGCHLA